MNSNAPQKILILDPLNPVSLTRFGALLPPGYDLVCASSRDESHQKEMIADAQYAISGQVPVTAPVLQAAKRLKLLHKWGVGVDNFDLEAARALGIQVARITGGNSIPVAEYTLGLMIAAIRNLAYGHAELMKGQWRGFPLPQDSFMISGKTVGIIGFGAIGQRLARLLSGFGCRIMYSKRTPLDAQTEASLGAQFATPDQIFVEADIISVNCPLNAQTAGLINRAAFEKMKPSAVLVNVARGGIVVEDDLYWALKNRVIHAAATDVYEIEPLPPTSPLLTLDNIVVSPHLAALAADNFAPCVTRMIANIERVRQGEPIPDFEIVLR